MIEEVYLYKTGRFQKDFEYLFDKIEVVKYVVDTKEECIDDKYITLDELFNMTNRVLTIICSRVDDEIEKTFNEHKMYRPDDYLWIEELGYLLNESTDYILNGKEYIDYTNEELFKTMIYKESYEEFKCRFPFSFANIEPSGSLHLCCPGYGFNYLGNILNNNLEDLWYSNRAKLFRLSIINKTYAFCDRKTCPYLKKSNFLETDTRYNDIKVYDNPNEIYVSIDKRCNLHCTSCRSCFYNPSEDDNNVRELAKKYLLESKWLSKADRLCFAGDGEVFFGKTYLELLESDEVKKRDSIEILTNGNLMTKEVLDKLVANHKKINIYISMDAASDETYSKIRLGGNFKKLINNLEYLSKLKKENKINVVELNFVIQRDNFKEINDFIQIVKKLDFDGANFSIISNWGTYEEEEFTHISMVNEAGIPNDELKSELDKVAKEDYKYITESSFLYNYFLGKQHDN